MPLRPSDPSKTRASLARPEPASPTRSRSAALGEASGEAPEGTPARPRGPVWRHAIEVEESLRPIAARRDAERAAERQAGFPYMRIAASAGAAGAVAVVGSIVLYRRELQRARLDRPRLLRGDPLPGVVAYVRPRIAAAAWKDSAGSLGCALVLWLAVFALPRTRRFALRWAALPALVGAGAWLGARWWFT